MINKVLLQPHLHELQKYVEFSNAAARFILGIAGAPASGKSTVSKYLCEELNHRFNKDIAIIVPMDGFHRYNEELEQLNLKQLKGIPETFNGQEFILCLERIRHNTDETVYCPEYDRTRSKDPIELAIAVQPTHRIVFVEGNYLLLEESPWHKVSELLDESWYLSRSMDETHPSLIKRHMEGGMTQHEAEAKVASTDLPNTLLVAATKKRADKVIKL